MYNRLEMVGRLTRDPELKYSQQGTAVATFAVATDVWTGKQETCFIECVMFGKRAEALSKNLKKGDPLHCAGRLVLEKWEKDGEKRQAHKCRVDDFTFLPRGAEKDVPF